MKPRAIVLGRPKCIACENEARRLADKGYDVTEVDVTTGEGQDWLADLYAILSNHDVPIEDVGPIVIALGVPGAGL